MKKSNLIIASVAALFACTNVIAQSAPETPWLLEGNSNVDQSIHWLGTTNSQDLKIKTNAVQRMVVSGTTGNIGIGETSPLYPLQIGTSSSNRGLSVANSTTGASARYGIYGSASGTGTGLKYGGWFESKNGSGTNTGIRATGNGTGTNYGTYSLAQGNNTNYGIYARAAGLFAGLGINYAVYGEVESGLGNSWAGYFLGRGYFSEKVGIGTTTTTALLNVAGSTTPMAIGVDNNYAGASSSYGLYNEMNGNATGPKYGFYTVVNQGSGYNYGVRAQVNDGANAYGVVGIATGTNNTYGVYGKANGTNNNIGIYGEGTIGNNSYGGYFLGRGYFSQRLGVGTSNPAAWLHVDADGNTLPFAVQINGASKLKANNNGSVSVGGISEGPDNGLYVNGSVTIGTSNPATGYKLSVNGKVMCTEMRVELQGNWPDYVFDADYKLPTIKEMEQHINQYNHLPGVPSAAEMKNAGGIDVGAMQTKMMEKIEEMSLYIIQLQKKIEKLESAVK